MCIIQKPKNLYKFYSNCNYLKDAIENKRIYMATADTFNDSFDSTINDCL